MSEKMFETAVRTKMRFPFKGSISVEDLWDLSVEELDSVFKTLNSRLKQSKEESLLEEKTKQDVELSTRIDIVKHIVSVKQSEETARLQARAKKEQKQKIMEILAKKQDEAIEGKTVEELQAMLASLD